MKHFAPHKTGWQVALPLLLLGFGGNVQSDAASWTALTHLAPGGASTMMQLTDGTIMIQSTNDFQSWMRLTPDALGSYINGTWTQNPIASMSIPREYFASEVLPNGKVWVLGGEYSGPGLVSNISATGEIYDPVANTWSAITTYPPVCNYFISRFGGNLTSGSQIVTGILSTTGFHVGWQVSGFNIPSNTTILSVDSASQIHLSQNAAGSGATVMQFTFPTTGNTTTGSQIITNIPSTAGLLAGFGVSGTGIPANATITSVDSANQIHISLNATATGTAVALTFAASLNQGVCFGDDPSILLPGGKILAGNIFTSATYFYDFSTDTWTQAGTKVYDRSDEEGWAMLADGRVLTYDIFKSISAGTGYAEIYNPATNTWSSISPADSTATGTLPLLSSNAVGAELGPILRLQDGRIFVIGANGHTAIYTPSTNTWAAGPNTVGTLSGIPSLLAADDAPAAILPNGHVILAADAGVLGFSSTGSTTAGSPIITNIPSTATLQVGWAVSGSGIPGNTRISTIDSASQIHVTQNATATASSVTLQFGGLFSNPTQLLDFDPVGGTISAVSPALPDANLSFIPSYVTRMLVLPTGQLLFSDSGNQLWIYTPDGVASPSLQPTVTQVVANGGGQYTLTGTQLTGQSAGSSYGDDVESDENYPIIRFVSGGGNVYYARTTNWSYVGVGGGATPQTVNFTLNPAMPAGAYSLIVSGAGISSAPFAITIGPDLTITKSHGGNFQQGQNGAAYTVTATNSGTSPTSGTVTVTDTIPAGLTLVSMSGTGWTCSSNSCNRSDALAAGASYPAITVTVNVAANAAASVTNTAAVAGGGESNTSNDSASDPTTINGSAPDLTIAKTHTGNFIQGQSGAAYTITVTNSGGLATSGTVTVTDTLPAGLTATSITGAGWTCTQPGGACARSDALAASASYPALTLTVNVAANAASSVTNVASVSGGGETNTANDSASDPTTILGPPDLTLTKTHVGNFSKGQSGAVYTITVTNSGPSATTGTVTVADTLPAGLTATSITGSGWTCTQPGGSCTRSDALAASASYPALTLTVNIAANAASSVTNVATVSGGGESNTANDSASDPTTINTPPDLTITKTHVGNFTQGQNGVNYTITVSNAAGSAATSGQVTVTDILPSGLTLVGFSGTGWACGLQGCNRSDSLAGGASYPSITIQANVAANATSLVQTATVSGGGETNTANDTANDPTTITPPGSPDLTITSTHSGNFYQTQAGAQYTITVTNSGGAAATGLVTVTETLPSGLTAAALNGSQWTCTQPAGPCTRSDLLGASASYPALILSVIVAGNAPASVTNAVSVSGGGESNTANDSSSDPTTVRKVAKGGVFRNGFSWLLDQNGSHGEDNVNQPGGDVFYAYGGIAGDIPITGDWNGSGTTKIGIYRASNGLFILDTNGNGVQDGADAVFNLGIGTVAGDVPVVGDWNGSGASKVGIFRQGFLWILDTNGDHTFNQVNGDQAFAYGGIAGDVPVVGDWNGSGTSKIGIFRQGFIWILDTNGNGSMDNIGSPGGDQFFAYGGIAGDVPIVGDWNGDGKGKIGIFRQGFLWVVDTNGNGSMDNIGLSGGDQFFPFGGLAGDKPVTGKW